MARNKKQGQVGFGTIEQRGVGGQFRARIYIHGTRRNKTFDTEQGAEAWLQARRAEHLRPDRATRTLEASELTLAGALKKRLDHTSDSKNHSNDCYAVARLEKDFPALCQRSIYDVDEIDIQDFIDARRKQVAPATVNRDISIFSHTFNLARTQFGCTHLRNPIGPTTRLKLPRGRVRRLSAEEEQTLLRHAALYEATSSIKIGSIIRFANDTAMRCGEITGMHWEHVDLDRGTVLLKDTKNGDSRSVPLWVRTRALLRNLGPMPSDLVWGAHEAVRSAWRRVRAAAIREAEANNNHALAKSLRDLRFHDFRHEGTSRLADPGLAGSPSMSRFPSASASRYSGNAAMGLLVSE